MAMLDAATAVFLERGYAGATLDEIIRRADAARRPFFTFAVSLQGHGPYEPNRYRDAHVKVDSAASYWSDAYVVLVPPPDRLRENAQRGAEAMVSAVVGAAGATTAMIGCGTEKVEKLVPYLVQSEDQVPGVATWYASTCTECPSGCGLHVRTREGRAVKLEGNPENPHSLGKLCARGQASLHGLYNPDRIPQAMQRK